MSVLSDETIIDLIDAGEIIIDPVDITQIQPASVDLHLGYEFLAILPNESAPVPLFDPNAPDPDNPYVMQEVPVISFSGGNNIEYTPYTDKYLRPQGFVLGTTIERISLPPDIGARVDGRSSIGRTGWFIENAGWIDPGFEGNITLELFNAAPFYLELLSGMRVCQLEFFELDGDCRAPYGCDGRNSKYQGQDGVQGSLIHEDEEFDNG